MLKQISYLHKSKYLLVIALFALVITLLNASIGFIDRFTHQDMSIKQNIEIKYRYFVDEAQTLDPSNILDSFQLFKPEQAKNIPYKLADQTYWIIGKYKNNTSSYQNLILHVDNAMLDQLEIYEIDDFMTVEPRFDLTKERQNSYLQTFPHYKFSLGGYAEQNLLIRLKTDGPPEIPLKLYQESGFQANTLASIALYGAFIAAILLMVSYNLVLYLAIKDKVYLVYMFYLFTTFFTTSNLNGFGFLLFPPETQLWLQSSIIQINVGIIVGLLLFSCYFLQYDKEKTWIMKTCYILTGVLTVLAIILSYLDLITQAKVFFTIQPFFYLFAIFLIAKKLVSTITWARYYFISWVPLLTGAAIQPLALLNVIESNFWTNHAFLIGVMVETVFMAFALGERMRMTEEEKIVALTYHDDTKIPKSTELVKAIKSLKQSDKPQFSVLAVEPEHINEVSLYLTNDEINSLYQSFEQGLNSLFLYNDKVEPLLGHSQKVCIDDTGVLYVLFKDEHKDELTVFIDSILRKFKEIYRIKDVNFPLSASIGVALHSATNLKSHELIQKSQLAIEYAKKQHRSWQVYEIEDYKKDAYLLELAADMIKAFKNNEFELVHQPQIDLKTLKVCGSEVLMRWTREDGTIVPNDVLVPLAIDIGLMKDISKWVFTQALRHQKEIIDSGNQNHLISINMTSQDICSENFFQDIVSVVEQSKIIPENIAIELKNPSELISSPVARDNMKKLNAYGLHLSVDDFGQGDSNISHISKLPCQELKLDNQLLENLLTLPKQRQIVKGTIAIAKSLGLEVVAEGINSQEEQDILTNLGCDIGQGFYYAPPMMLAPYLQWLEENRDGLKR